MKRLTKTFRNGECHTLRTCCAPYYKKLSQLEDIEEELGIDLVTLFKALKEGIYTLGNNEIEPVVLRMFYEEPMLVFETDTTEVYLKDYGKTWALTREELL